MRSRLFAILAFAFVFTSMCFAQTFAEVTGEVRDPSGALIAGARVTLTNTATNAIREAVANESGIYSFPLVQPGVYNLRVEKEGFRSVTRTSIELQVQQSARLDIEMTVGQVSCLSVLPNTARRSEALWMLLLSLLATDCSMVCL